MSIVQAAFGHVVVIEGVFDGGLEVCLLVEHWKKLVGLHEPNFWRTRMGSVRVDEVELALRYRPLAALVRVPLPLASVVLILFFFFVLGVLLGWHLL